MLPTEHRQVQAHFIRGRERLTLPFLIKTTPNIGKIIFDALDYPIKPLRSFSLLMHISATKIAFSLDEAFNYIQAKDPDTFARITDLLSNYAEKLYRDYPGTKLDTSPVTHGIQTKSIGVPIFFETPCSDQFIAQQYNRKTDNS